MAAGVGRDDEVIAPSFTFVATAEAVALAGAKPVFTDIDPKTYTLSPAAVEKAITKKTKAKRQRQSCQLTYTASQQT